MKKIVGFIPAKSNSSRVKNKNSQEIIGLPLYLWAAANLSRIIPKENIYIDSDGEEILNNSLRCGFKVIKRPLSLATNTTNGNQFFAWECSQVKADIYIQHLPPMPFLRLESLKKAKMAVCNQGFDSAFACYRKHFYTWNINKKKPEYNIKRLPNSLDLPEKLIEAMGFYMITRQAFEKTKTRIGKRPYFLEISPMEAIDIDWPQDLEFARIVANGMREGFDYINPILLAYKNIPHNIKLIVFDVDGTLTDGGMYYSEYGDEIKKFNTKDGIGIQNLRKRAILTCMLSAGKLKKIMENRCRHLKIDFLGVNIMDKAGFVRNLCNKLKIRMANVAFVGDDINDIVLMKQAGFSCCPSDAHNSVKSRVSLILESKGGSGVLREIADLFERFGDE